MNIRVIDDFIHDPGVYRHTALALPFIDVPADGKIFRGMAFSNLKMEQAIPGIRALSPDAGPTASFFRKSPLGQVEPNYIHSDAEMGDWTGILYLNPEPVDEDGTVFWRHRRTNSLTGEDWKAEGHSIPMWDEICRVPAKFNRLLLFDAKLYHSRSLVQNYGEGDDARLIQVIFGKGEIPWQ